MFRDLTLAECLEHAATPQQWRDYQEVMHAKPPALFNWEDPLRGASAAYRAKDRIEHEIWRTAVRKLRAGEWSAIGRWTDEPYPIAIDRRLWGSLTCDFSSFRMNKIWSGSGPDGFADVAVSQTDPDRRTGQHVPKADLKRRLRQWLDAQAEAKAAPRSEPDWRAEAKAHFAEDDISDNLFRSVWRALKYPHPLKFNGRPHHAD